MLPWLAIYFLSAMMSLSGDKQAASMMLLTLHPDIWTIL